MKSARPARRSQQGAGLLSAVFGIGVFIAFLGLVVQVVVYLYAASSVVDAAQVAARRAASRPVDDDPQSIEREVRERLGRFAANSNLRVNVNEDDVDVIVVTIDVDTPAMVVPRPIAAGLRLAHVHRVIRVRRERFRQSARSA